MKITTYCFLMLACSFADAQQYVNGSMSTGAVTQSGLAAPAGRTWGELQHDSTINMTQTYSTFSAGIGNPTFPTKWADDFTVPPGQSWHITKFEAFSTIVNIETMLFDTICLEIWNGAPMQPGSQKIYGDLTTNIFNAAGSGDAMIDIIENTLENEAPWETRRLWRIAGTVDITLPPGTYWVFYRLNSFSNNAGIQTPFCIVPNAYGHASYNAKYFFPIGSVWNTPNTAGLGQDFPFTLNYTAILGVDDADRSGITMYPNPTEGNLFFRSDNAAVTGDLHLTVSDMRGVKVLESEVAGTGDLSVDISSLQDGLYIVTLADRSKLLYQGKVVKK